MKRRTKKRLFVVLLVPALALVVVAVLWGGRIRRERMLESARADGMAAYAQRDYAEALRRLSRYVGRRNDDGEALLAFADSRARTPMPNNLHLVRAVAPNRLAATILPGDPRPLRNLLSLYAQLGFESETVDTADLLLAIAPGDPEALRAKAMSLYRLGGRDESRAAAEAALQGDPTSAWALGIVAETRLQSGEEATSIERWLLDVVAQHPDNVDVLLTLARVQTAAAEPELAIETLRTASSKAPTDVDQARRLLTSLDATGLGDAGDRLLAHLADERFAALAVERLWKQGMIGPARDKAAATLSAAEGQRPNLTGLAVLLGVEGAAARLEELALSDDIATATTAQHWKTLLDCRDAMDRGDHDDAVDGLRALQTRLSADAMVGPLSAATAHQIGAACAAQGNLSDALAAWRALLAVDPSWTLASASVATELMNAGRADEAYVEALAMLVRAPRNPLAARVYLSATSLLLEQGAILPEAQANRLDESITQLREAVRDDGDLLCIVAQIQLSRGDLDGARDTVAAIERAARPASAVRLARLANMAIDADPAMRDAVVAIAEQSGAAGGEFVIADAIARGRAGDLEGGLALLDEAIGSASEPQRLALERARAQYLRSVDQRRALEALRALASRETGNPLVQTDLLQHPLAWEDCTIAEEALRRLGAIVGQEASLWRQYEARRLLACDGTKDSAASALLLLAPVLEADPMAVEPRLLAAEAELSLDDRAGAIERLADYVTRGGRDIRVHLRLAPLLREAGQVQEAGDVVERSLEIEPIPAGLRVSRGRLLEQWGMPEQARADYLAAALAGDRAGDLAMIAYGARTGDVEPAEEAVARLLARGTMDMMAREVVANFRATGGDVEGALALLREASEGDDERTMAMARLLSRHGRDVQAAELLRERADAGGGAAVWSQLISLRLEALELDEANELLDLAVARFPDDSGLQALRGAVTLAGGAPEDAAAALAAINAALAQRNGDPALIEMGQILERYAGNRLSRDQYIESLAALASRRPTYLLAWRTLIAECIRSGRDSEAAEAAQSMAAALPGDSSALRLATETLAGVRRFDAALAMAQAWRRATPEDVYQPDLATAQLLGMLGRHTEGLAAIDRHRPRIVAEAETNPAPLTLLAELLAGAGHESDARALFDGRSDSNDDWARRQIAIASTLRSRPLSCRAWLDACEPWLATRPELDIALGAAWRTLAQSTDEATDYARAAALLSSAAERAPNATLLVTLAETQAGAGAPADAERTLRRVLESGDDPVAMNNLAALIAEHRPTDAEAAQLAARAVEIARGARIPPQAVASFLDTHGFALLRAGRAADALPLFGEALRLDPSLADSIVGTAEAHIALGNAADAQAALSRLPAIDTLPRPLAKRALDAQRSLGGASPR